MNQKAMASRAIEILRDDASLMVRFSMEPDRTLEQILGIDLTVSAAKGLVELVQTRLARGQNKRRFFLFQN